MGSNHSTDIDIEAELEQFEPRSARASGWSTKTITGPTR